MASHYMFGDSVLLHIVTKIAEQCSGTTYLPNHRILVPVRTSDCVFTTCSTLGHSASMSPQHEQGFQLYFVRSKKSSAAKRNEPRPDLSMLSYAKAQPPLGSGQYCNSCRSDPRPRLLGLILTVHLCLGFVFCGPSPLDSFNLCCALFRILCQPLWCSHNVLWCAQLSLSLLWFLRCSGSYASTNHDNGQLWLLLSKVLGNTTAVWTSELHSAKPCSV